jgi:hypothetical protein
MDYTVDLFPAEDERELTRNAGRMTLRSLHLRANPSHTYNRIFDLLSIAYRDSRDVYHCQYVRRKLSHALTAG